MSLIPHHCALCRRWTRNSEQAFGEGFSRMTGRFCAECLPVVKAADVGGVVQVVARELSARFDAIRVAA